jgi:hypothetical protein
VNAGLDFNMSLVSLFSAFGGGIVVLPWVGAKLTASVVDPSATPTSNDITDAFQDGVLVGGEGRVTVKPFGLIPPRRLR